MIKPFPNEKGEKTRSYIFRRDLYPEWNRRSDDFAICRDIYNKLQEFDIWIAHNGVNYDVNFLRTRLLKRDVIVQQPKIVDPCKLSRKYLRLSGNSLAKVSAHLGLGEKTVVDGKYWNEAALDGSKSSMDYIVKHCVIDVQVLENAMEKLKPFVPKVSSWGSDV